jgi:hypothetical protein
MSDMLKILRGLDAIEKKTLNESAIAECDMPTTSPASSGPVSINITGDVASMAAMLKLMGGANSGADLLSPVGNSFRDDPAIPGRDDVEGDTDLQAGFLGGLGGAIAGGAAGGPAGAIGGGIAGSAAQDAVTNKLAAGGNDDPDIPGRDDVEGDQDLDAGFLGGLGGAIAGGALGGPAGAIGGGIAGSTAQNAVNAKVDAIGKESTNELNYDASTEPDEKYVDQDKMDDLAGGINGKKKMYKPSARGDNPMAVEMKARLMAALSEKKAKPDFLDVDKDGDKKEPMKKAVADKKTTEAAISEISSDLAKRYTKAAKMDRDFNDDDLERLSTKRRYGTDDQSKQAGAEMTALQRKNSKRQKGINTAKKSMSANEAVNESVELTRMKALMKRLNG